MKRALELARMCETEPGKSEPSPKVGAVAIDASGRFLGEAFRGSRSTGDHAEYCLITELEQRLESLRGATVFTTLEPCTRRNPPKIPCAERLIEVGVSVVFIGMLDPDPAIRELGWKTIGDAGIERRAFSEELRTELQLLNSPFIGRFRVARGLAGQIRFDYMQNAGELRIENEGATFVTKWTMAGKGSIHAYDSPGSIALARTACKFEDVDDPGMFEFRGRSKHVHEGQIVIFKSSAGYVLVRVESVLAGADRGDSHTEAVISYELRLHD